MTWSKFVIHLRRYWWVGLGLILGAAFVLFRLSRPAESGEGLPAGPSKDLDDAIRGGKSVVDIVRSEARSAELDLQIETEKDRIDEAKDRAVLDDIRSEPDVEVKRERLARWLQYNL
jgi:hypothetical protein